jgi:hypothetical protein
MFDFSRSDIPVVPIGTMDDSLFTPGDQAAWADLFVGAYRTARGNGVPLLGDVRLSIDVATRMMGGAPSMDLPVQFLTTLNSGEYDGLRVFADASLPSDTAILI